MKKPSLEETVRGLLSEQQEVKQAWNKEIKPKINIGRSEHDPTGPNMSHIEEDIPGSQFGMRHNPKKHPFKKSLGALEKRQWGGNQRRTPGMYTEEATKKALKKVDDKKKARGKTDTGQAADVVDLEPTLQSMINNR